MPPIHPNLGRCFDANRAPSKVAIIDTANWDHPREWTYAELDAECDAVARGLVATGLQRGDRVGILALNRFELLAAYFGTMRAGLVSVPISFKLPRETIAHIVQDADLRAVFCDRERAGLCPAGLLQFNFDDPSAASPSSYLVLRDPGPFDTLVPVQRELAMILYTSGSTGKPKGVLLSHASQRWSLETSARTYGERPQHRYIVAAPMFHMNATISVKGALAAGGSIVLLPSFDARKYAQAVEKFRVTWLTSVPTMLALWPVRVRWWVGSTSPLSPMSPWVRRR